MDTPRFLITTEPQGMNYGDRFDAIPPADLLPDAVISSIVVAYDSSTVTGVEVHYATGNPPAVRHGGAYSSVKTFDLVTSEYVTMIEGSLNESKIGHLKFFTNKRILGTAGNPRLDRETFIWSASNKVPSHAVHRMGLLSFTGLLSSSNIMQLQATFANYPCEEVNANYENVSTPPIHTTIQVSSAARSPALLPSFAVLLMAPIITIHAGPQRTEYHASEYILCQLPFFRACLKGKFKEAAEKTINMPDDDSDCVAALIEFLYKGSYTYAYDNELTKLHPKSGGGILDVPISDFRQALFHLNVYTIGCKYDFQALAAAAIQNVRVISRDIDGIGLLQVCEAIYHEGLQLSDLRKGEDSAVFKERITQWVKGICIKNREELVQATSKFPVLACDLLDVMAGASD